MKRNVLVVYDVATEEPRMIVIDAQNPDDPAWNPEGHAKVELVVTDYRGIEDHEALKAHVAEKIAQEKK